VSASDNPPFQSHGRRSLSSPYHTSQVPSDEGFPPFPLSHARSRFEQPTYEVPCYRYAPRRSSVIPHLCDGYPRQSGADQRLPRNRSRFFLQELPLVTPMPCSVQSRSRWCPLWSRDLCPAFRARESGPLQYYSFMSRHEESFLPSSAPDYFLHMSN